MDGGTLRRPSADDETSVTTPGRRCAHCDGNIPSARERRYDTCSTACATARRAASQNARFAVYLDENAAHHAWASRLRRAGVPAEIRAKVLAPLRGQGAMTPTMARERLYAGGWLVLSGGRVQCVATGEEYPPVAAPPLRASLEPVAATDAPPPASTTEAPRMEPQETVACVVDPWSLPSPSAEYAGYFLEITITPCVDPPLTLRTTRLLHGALSAIHREPHRPGLAHFALVPRGEDAPPRAGTPPAPAWDVLFYERAIAERLRGTSHTIYLSGGRAKPPDVLDRTLSFGERVFRVRAPAALPAGRYRVVIDTRTPLSFTTDDHRVCVERPHEGTITGSLERVAKAVGVTVRPSDLAIARVAAETYVQVIRVGTHWQRGTGDPGSARTIAGRVVVECNAVAAWLLLCARRTGLGGMTSIGFGRVRVTAERLDAPDELACLTDPRRSPCEACYVRGEIRPVGLCADPSHRSADVPPRAEEKPE